MKTSVLQFSSHYREEKNYFCATWTPNAPFLWVYRSWSAVTTHNASVMKKWPKPQPNLSIKHPEKKNIMEDLSKRASMRHVLCAWTVHWALVSGEWFQIQQSQLSLKMNQIAMLSWGLPVLCGTFLCSSLEYSWFGSAPWASLMTSFWCHLIYVFL